MLDAGLATAIVRLMSRLLAGDLVREWLLREDQAPSAGPQNEQQRAVELFAVCVNLVAVCSYEPACHPHLRAAGAHDVLSLLVDGSMEAAIVPPFGNGPLWTATSIAIANLAGQPPPLRHCGAAGGLPRRGGGRVLPARLAQLIVGAFSAAASNPVIVHSQPTHTHFSSAQLPWARPTLTGLRRADNRLRASAAEIAGRGVL